MPAPISERGQSCSRKQAGSPIDWRIPASALWMREACRTRACPVLEDQLADIYQVLTAVSEGHDVREDTPLDSARAAYIGDLRERHLAFTQLVAEVAAVCACVFLQESAG